MVATSKVTADSQAAKINTVSMNSTSFDFTKVFIKAFGDMTLAVEN